MTDDASLQPAVAAEFLALADLLESATDAQWDTPSLCEGWRVREVVAHMTMAARYPEDKFMAELRRCDFDFGRLSNEIASRDAGLPPAELVASLRSDTMQHWVPPGGGYHGALNHVVIHGLDITVPLGVPRRSTDETIRIVLDELTRGHVHVRFGTNIDGRWLQATDLDWSYGSGPMLRGAAEDLALMLCGRALPPERIEGEPLSQGQLVISSSDIEASAMRAERPGRRPHTCGFVGRDNQFSLHELSELISAVAPMRRAVDYGLGAACHPSAPRAGGRPQPSEEGST
jgi:uncharacterized protein (TIGR03083 family)